MQSNKYGHFNPVNVPVKEWEMEEWIGKHGKAWRVCWQQWARRRHHQQLNLGHGRYKTWVEATETQGNTISWRQTHKQALLTNEEKSQRRSHPQWQLLWKFKAAQVSPPFVHGNKRQDVELPGNSLSCKQLQCHKEEIQVSIINCILPAWSQEKYPWAGKANSSFINTVI